MLEDDEKDLESSDALDSDLDLETEEAEPDPVVGRGDRRFGKLSKENRELRDRIARMEGKLEAAGQKAPDEPTYDSDQDEFNAKLLAHSKTLEQKLKRLEDKETATETAQKQAKIIARAMSGLGFEKQAGLAKEHLSLYIQLNPAQDADDVREYARKLAKKMGVGEKTYLEEKKADQAVTKRPSQSVISVAPKGNGPQLNKAQRLQATRDEALARLRATSK
jgi:hypothetical protein